MNKTETKNAMDAAEAARLLMPALAAQLAHMGTTKLAAQVKAQAARFHGRPLLYIGGATDPIAAMLKDEGHQLQLFEPGSDAGRAELANLLAQGAVAYAMIILQGRTRLEWVAAEGACPMDLLAGALAPDGALAICRVAAASLPLLDAITVESGDIQAPAALRWERAEDGACVLHATLKVGGAEQTLRLRPGFGQDADLDAALKAAGMVGVERSVVEEGGFEQGLTVWRRRNQSPLCQPFSPLPLSADPSKLLVLDRGQGCEVRDQAGKRYIDACGGLWNTQIGLGNTEVIEAINVQLQRLSYSTLFAERSNAPAAELAKMLVSLAPYPMQWVCYTGSGSESTDLAIRLALLYQVLCGKKERKTIVHLDESYHGTFGSSASVSGLMPLKDLYQSNISSLAIPTPNRTKCPASQTYADFALACANALEEKAKTGNVAAFIVEPMLGSAGVIIPPPEYFQRIRAICDQYGIVLIVDEVATGFGRTGRWFACEHYGLEPDILLLAKGINSGYLPLGAVMFSGAIGEKFIKYNLPLLHGSTYNGHPVCCASALANLEVIKREGLIARSDEVGKYFKVALGKLLELELVTEVRGVGLMLAVGVQQTDGSAANGVQLQSVMKRLQAAGLLVYPSLSSITLCPALVISKEEIDQVVQILYQVLSSITLSGGEVQAVPAASLAAAA